MHCADRRHKSDLRFLVNKNYPLIPTTTKFLGLIP